MSTRRATRGAMVAPALMEVRAAELRVAIADAVAVREVTDGF